jgi:hypothetical protein
MKVGAMIIHTRNIIIGISVLMFSLCFGCVGKTNTEASPSAVPSTENLSNVSMKYTEDIGTQHICQISIPANENAQKLQVTIAIYQDSQWFQENKFTYRYEKDAEFACGISEKSAAVSYGSQPNHSIMLPSSFADGNAADLWQYTNMNQLNLTADKDTLLSFLSLNCQVPQSDIFDDWTKFTGDGAAAILIKLSS